jgi:type II secretory pathway component PulF
MTIKQRYMLFAQLGNMLKAGIPPHQAFAQLASYSRRVDHANALNDISKRTAEGTSMADAMSPYIDMFQPGEVGGIRAGEMGGYAPDAADAVSDQLKTMNKFRLWFWWCGLVAMASLMSLPLVAIAANGLEESAKTINTTGPMNRGVVAMFQGWGAALLGPPGWFVAAIFLGYVLFRIFWFRTENLANRHGMALKTPLSSKRAVRENVIGFAWHLERLTISGLPPNRCWMLASEAVPNIAFARRLTAMGRGMTDESRISDTLKGANVFPEEFWPMVSTGELTGTLPEALNEAAQLSRADMQSTESHIKWRAGCWFILLSIGTTGLVYILFMMKYIDVLLKYVAEP